MYEIAKSARTKLKNKARQMATASGEKVDSSDWTPAEPLNSEIKVGMRPISPRAYKKGGKVSGEAATPRADRKARKNGGRLVAKDIAEAKVNRNVKAANALRPGGKAHVGGYKKGGAPGGDYSVTGAGTVTKDKEKSAPTPPMPPRRPVDVSPTFDYSVTGADTVTREGEKRGGRAKKMFGGPMKDPRENIVKPARFNFGQGAQGTPYKKGGMAKHPDVAEDKTLIKKMVKPSALTGKKDGGETDGKWIQKAIKHPGALRKALHVKEGEKIPEKKLEKAEHSKNPTMRKRAQLAENLKRMNRATGGQVFSGPGYPGKVPGVTGGRKAHASGGKAAKGKTDINIVIGTGKGDDLNMPPKGMPPQLPQRMPVPAPAPAPASMPPMGMAPGAAPPVPMPPPGLPGPTARKHGGRLTKVAHSYKDMQAGAGSGEGRLQKTDIAKARMGRKVGGRAYRSYKDMDAGAGSGEGRLEKTEIQRSKRVH